MPWCSGWVASLVSLWLLVWLPVPRFGVRCGALCEALRLLLVALGVGLWFFCSLALLVFLQPPLLQGAFSKGGGLALIAWLAVAARLASGWLLD